MRADKGHFRLFQTELVIDYLKNKRIYRLAHAPGDELGILTTEIENRDYVSVRSRLRRAGSSACHVRYPRENGSVACPGEKVELTDWALRTSLRASSLHL